MQCFTGAQVNGNLFPCGQCMPCLINKGRKWTARILLEERENYERFQVPADFYTLTYAPEYCPTVPDAPTKAP